MALLPILLICLTALGLAYVLYGKLVVSRFYRLDCHAPTPATLYQDGLDYVPTNRFYLLAQHFSAISAAGPIFGPIIAGLMFGWLPALLWIVLGCIFIGAVHDFSTLVGSVRHRGSSVAEVVRLHIGPRAFYLFLGYIWLSLVYVLTAFTDVTARAFTGTVPIFGPGGEQIGTVLGAGTASSSVMYLGLGILLGTALKLLERAGPTVDGRRPLVLRQVLLLGSLLLVGVVIWAGQSLPLSLPVDEPVRVWSYVILAYCGVASVLPVWLLLQPRGFLGGAFLYTILLGGLVGVLLGGAQGGLTLQYPSYLGFSNERIGPLVPFLFITIACGACSGFHGMVSSGTTSKQLRCECDAPLVGYGGMLLEGVIALLALACVMILAPTTKGANPDAVFAAGIGQFLSVLGVPLSFAVSFGMLAFATFVFDTIDVTTRLGRYLLQELFGWKTLAGKTLATLLTLCVPAVLLGFTVTGPDGKPIPAYLSIWPVFGASNQLLAALSLLGLFVWLVRREHQRWAVFLVGVPMAFMMTMTLSALFFTIQKWIVAVTNGTRTLFDPVGIASTCLVVLAVGMILEGVAVLRRPWGVTPRLEPDLAQ
ncbi:MAG: carbon starvation protein A [Candidatus Binatia bacterium]|nr:carbon starvation protein A [Candidatus Binatia bacterium]